MHLRFSPLGKTSMQGRPKKRDHHTWRLISSAYVLKTSEPISMIFGILQTLFHYEPRAYPLTPCLTWYKFCHLSVCQLYCLFSMCFVHLFVYVCLFLSLPWMVNKDEYVYWSDSSHRLVADPPTSCRNLENFCPLTREFTRSSIRSHKHWSQCSSGIWNRPYVVCNYEKRFTYYV